MKYENLNSLIKDLEAYRQDALQGRGMTKEEVLSVTKGAIDYLTNMALEGHNIGLAYLEKLLGGEYSDYESLELTAEEYSELENRARDIDDIEEVQKIVNIYLREIGFKYNDNNMVFSRK